MKNFWVALIATSLFIPQLDNRNSYTSSLINNELLLIRIRIEGIKEKQRNHLEHMIRLKIKIRKLKDLIEDLR